MAEQGKKVAERVKAVAKEDAQKVQALATEAFQSHAYLYPVKGQSAPLPVPFRSYDLTPRRFLLLPLPQGTMETALVKASSYHHVELGCHHLHVLRSIPSTGRRHDFHLRTYSSFLSSTPYA